MLAERWAATRAAMRTVRWRSTLLAALLMSIALALGAVVMLLLYRNQLEANLDQTLRQQAQDRALLLDEGNSPDALVTVLQEEALVWIGTPEGEAVAIGGAIFPLENPVPPTIGDVSTIDILVEERKPDEVEQERMDLRVGSVLTADGALVVLAGAETEVIDETLSGLVQLFVLAVPILGLLVGGVTFFTAGRVLEPVERIRTQAEGIGGETLGERVPVPESGDEIHDLAVTMNSMLDRLEAHERSLRQFSADASHELKSPIANVRALVDTTELNDPEWSQVRSRLTGETDRLRDLVDNLLFLAASSGGRRRRPPAPVDLDDLVFDEAELLASTTAVSVDLSGIEPVQVLGDRGDLQRLVRNLADNAARHASGRVRFTTSTTGSMVELRVADDGDGIAEEDRGRVFERFTRLDEARARDDGGSGLGLSIVRQIAEYHDGSITVGTADLGGAEFRVVLPAP